MDGLWTLINIGVPVGLGTELLLMGFMMTDLDLGGGLLEARHAVTPWLSAAPGVLVAHRPVPGGEALEWRYRFDVTLHKEAGPLRLAWRALLERRHLAVEIGDEPTATTALTMLRNRLRVEFPLRAGSRSMAPFTAAEEFQDLSAGVAVQVWLMMGLMVDTGDGVRLESYYLRRVVRGALDSDALVLSVYWRP